MAKAPRNQVDIARQRIVEALQTAAQPLRKVAIGAVVRMRSSTWQQALREPVADEQVLQTGMASFDDPALYHLYEFSEVTVHHEIASSLRSSP